jgi:hypothetical protein
MTQKKLNELELLSDINKKLETLTAIMAIRGLERDEQIKILSFLGYSNSEISKYTLIPKGTVDVVRAKLSKETAKT